jgi:hypothetical protein
MKTLLCPPGRAVALACLSAVAMLSGASALAINAVAVPLSGTPPVLSAPTVIEKAYFVSDPVDKGGWREDVPSGTQTIDIYSKTADVLFKRYGAGHVVTRNVRNLKFFSRYRVTAVLSASAPIKVQLALTGGATYQEPFAAHTITVSSTKRTVVFEGTYAPGVQDLNSSNALARLFLSQSDQAIGVLLKLHSFQIEEVPINPIAPLSVPAVNINFAAPSTLMGFGSTVIGRMWNMPEAGQQVIRFWDTATTWADAQPTQAVADDSSAPLAKNFTDRMGALLGYIDTVNRQRPAGTPALAPLMELGFSPAWVSAAGTNGSPTDKSRWVNYVQLLKDRYGDRIKFWEVWNEWDIPQHFAGSAQDMVTLTCKAYDVIKGPKHDGAAVVLSPSVTTANMAVLDSFLDLGGGKCVDAIAMHANALVGTQQYLPAAISNVRTVMAQHGYGSLPVWITESAPSACRDFDPACDLRAPVPLSRQKGLMPIAVSTLLANRVSNISPHQMEGGAPADVNVWDFQPWNAFARMRSPALDGEHTFDFTTLTPFGAGYKAAGDWFKGATVQQAYPQGSDLVVVKLRAANGKTGYVVWTTNPDGKRVTAQYSWGIKTVTRIHTPKDINGVADAFDVPDQTLPTSTTPFNLVPDEPVLLMP